MENEPGVDRGSVELCSWTVTAGFEPQEAADRFTRTLVLTYEDWSGGDVPGQRLRAARREEAVGYASKLLSDESFAWVNLEYRSNDSPWTESAASDGWTAASR